MANLKENERALALEIYLNRNVTQAAIAREVGVSERTISVWATEDNWKAIKKARFHSPRVEEQRLYEEMRVISTNISKRPPHLRFPTKEEMEIRTKIIAMINALDTVKGQWRNISYEHDLHIPEEHQQQEHPLPRQQSPGQEEQQARRA